MITQPSESEKTAILAQILKSLEFQDSKRHQELLQYLVEKSSTVSSLKETEIAQEVFGKDSKFDPATDPVIRSYVSNLRKKLDHYYLTTEDKFEYKLEIPKGHYLVKYSNITSPPKTKSIRIYLSGLYPSIIIILSVIVAILTFREFEHSTSSNSDIKRTATSPIWNDFIQPKGRPTLIVLGDFFFMRERDKNDGYLRLIKINTIDDYLEYIRQNPEFGKRYTKNNFTFLRPSAPWGLMQILPILQNTPNGISLKLASQFTSDDFKANNIVFIGSFKTLYLFKNFLNILKIDYSIAPSSFRIQDGLSDSAHVFTPERLSAGNLEKDYGVVAKGQGPDGSCIILLLGFSESGVIQATHAASDPMLLKTIAAKYPSNPSINPASFTLVIGAEGMTQSLYNADIKYLAGVGAPQPVSGSGQKDTTRPR